MWNFNSHGLLVRQHALEAGISPREVDEAGRADQLIRVERGIYVDPATVPTGPKHRRNDALYRARSLAVAGRREADSLLSHQSAAAVHGLDLLEPDRSAVHVTNAKGKGGKVRGRHCVVHPTPCTESEVVVVDGVRVTSVMRTAVDVARTAPGFPQALAAMDSALRLGAIRDEIAECIRPRSQGAGRARHALMHADGLAANAGESWSRAQMIAAGLPVPQLQVRYVLPDGSVAFVDFDWEGKVVGEFDGLAKYSGEYLGSGEAPADVVVKEKQREDGLRSLYLDVGRWVVADLRRNRMIGPLRRRLERHGII